MSLLLKAAIWGASLFIVFSIVILSLALYTSLPDRIGNAYLKRYLEKSGGTLVIKGRKGSLVSGTDLYGVTLVLPDRLRFESSHIHLKLDPWLIPAGVFSLSNVSAEKFVLMIERKADKDKEQTAGGLPPWMHIRAPGVKLVSGKVIIDSTREGSAPIELSEINARMDFIASGRRSSVRKMEVSCVAGAPLPRHIDARGNLFVISGGRAGCDLFLNSSVSKVRVRGNLSRDMNGIPSFKTRLDSAPVSLREVAIGWESAPDIFLTGTTELTWEQDNVRWSGKVEEKTLGIIRSSGEIRTVNGRVEVNGEAVLKNFSPEPFLHDANTAGTRLSGEGSFHVTVVKNVDPVWEFSANLESSEIKSIPFGSAVLKLKGSGREGSAQYNFSSPVAGRGAGSAVWSDGGENWKADLSAKEVSLFDLISGLGYPANLPKPLREPEGTWNVPGLSLVSNSEGFKMSASLKHPSVGESRFELRPFLKGKPLLWTFRSTGIDPALWGAGPSGRIAGEVKFEGPAADRGEFNLSTDRSEWSTVVIEPLKVQIYMEAGGAIRMAPFNLKTSVGKVNGRADFTPGKGWGGSFTGSVADLSALDAFMGNPGLRGALDADVTIGKAPDGPEFSGSMRVRSCCYGKISANEVKLKGAYGSGSGLLKAEASWSGLSIGGTTLGDGEGSLTGNSSSATARVDASLGEERRLSVEALTTFDKGQVSMTIGKLSVSIADQTFRQDGPARLAWGGKSLEWSGISLSNAGSVLQLEGLFGFSEEGSGRMSGRIKAVHLPLALLPLPETAGTIAGTVDADLQWGGTIDAPSLSGSARLSEGVYRFAESDLEIRHVTGTMKAEGNRLLLTSVTATTDEGGSATASGFVRFHGFLPEIFELKAEGKSFPFVLGRDMEGSADFAVKIGGSPAKPVISGEAKILKGRIQLPDLQRQQPLPPTIKFVNTPVGSPYSSSDESSEGGPVTGALRGSIKLTSKGELWVSNRNLIAELSGTLIIRFTDKGPVITGTLELINGRYIFQNHKFHILDSRLYFSGTTDLMPYFDVNASYEASGAVISLRLTGAADRPELHLSSQPPMPEGDILSTLLFGRSSGDLSTAENRSWASTASMLALQYQALPLVESVQNKLGLDSIDMGTSPTGGTEVGFSKYIGDKTVLEYRQTFGTLPESRVNLRYRINRRLSLRTENTDTGNAGLDLLWENRY